MTCRDFRQHDLESVASTWDRLARRAERDGDESFRLWRRVADRAARALDAYRASAEELD
jgi:hypothetical protein